MITIGETTADAPLPDFGTIEKAIPSAVEQALPKITNQVKVIHLLISVGISNPKNRTPNPSNIKICTAMLAKIRIAFPMK